MESNIAKPFFSIITCTYNSEKFLNDSINSVYSQTCQNYEHIFVDGYSTDNTLRIIEKYIKDNKEKNIRLIQSKPSGVSNAMNLGIKNATGEVIHFLHSDDYYYDEKTLKKAKTHFDNNPNLKWLIGNRVLQFDLGQIRIKHNLLIKTFGKEILKFYNWISHPNTFMHKSVFDEFDLFDEKFRISMDYDMFLRIINKAEYLITEEDYVVFRRHKGSISTVNSVDKLIAVMNEDKLAREKNNSSSIIRT